MSTPNDTPTPEVNQVTLLYGGLFSRKEIDNAVFTMNDWTEGQFHIFDRISYDPQVAKDALRVAELAIKYGGFVNPRLTVEGTDTAQRIIAIMENIAKYATETRVHLNVIANDNSGILYVVQMRGTTWFKIGVTSNMGRRLSTLQNANPLPLDVVTELLYENVREAELSLHDRFWRKRMQGEWFSLDADDVAYIKSLAVSS